MSLDTTVYVAGKMTGVPEFNFPAFDEAAADLRARGWTVINPAEHDRANGFDPTGLTGNESPESLGFDLKAALLWDLEQVANADAVYVLRGSEQSRGTRAELALAVALGKRVIRQPAYVGLIGLGGKLASGKDEVADALVREAGYVKIGMSDILRDALITLNPIVEVYRDIDEARAAELIEDVGYVEAKRSPEVRRLLQVLGTEVGRNMLGENVWVDAVARRIKELWGQNQRVVLTGVRYPNEVAMVKRLQGRAVWISRPGHEQTGSHSSENSVSADDFDQVLVNDGSLETLYEKSLALLK